MKLTVSQKNLQILNEKMKLYSYLSSTLTRTYMKMSKKEITIFLSGVLGAIRTTSVLDESSTDTETHVFLIDYGKWLTALSKVSFSQDIVIDIDKKSLKLSIPGSTDKISLGITTIEEGSADYNLIDSFISETKTNKVVDKRLTVTDQLLKGIEVAESLFSNNSRNDTIAVNKKRIMYADRSIIFQYLLDDKNLSDDDVFIHKYIVGMIRAAEKYTNEFFTDEDYSVFYWQDENTECILASEPKTIEFPLQSDLESWYPTENTVKVSRLNLLNGLEFFNGFYESSVWKPITMEEAAGGLKLHYQHPTAEVSKVIDVIEASDSTNIQWIISSEMLLKIIKEDIDNDEVQITYDEESAGVRFVIEGVFDVFFAKLVE